tara:strand:- start:7 stop:387 length:381 start_codon:yes stop_codon:yes gene_type:complete
MKITKQQLRNSIRKVLLENKEQKNKLIDGILIGDPENINTFLDLAETLGYVERLRYEVEPPLSYFPEEQHTWNFDAEPEFGDLLINKYMQRSTDEDSEVMTVEFNGALFQREGIYSFQINAIGSSE